MMLLLMVNIVYGLSVDRTISGSSITLTIDGDSNNFGGIVSETLPSGYSPTGISSSSLGVQGTASGKVTGQLFEIAFGVDGVNPATITYGISGSGSGTISGSVAFGNDLGVVSTTGDSQLGGGQTCSYSSTCDESDTCGNTRNTDGTVCGTDKECSSGTCTTVDTCDPTRASNTCGTDCDGFYNNCISGYHCSGATCVVDSTTPECTLDSQCSTGQECRNEQCVDVDTGNGGTTGNGEPKICPDGTAKEFWENDDCDGLSMIVWIILGVIGVFAFMNFAK